MGWRSCLHNRHQRHLARAAAVASGAMDSATPMLTRIIASCGLAILGAGRLGAATCTCGDQAFASLRSPGNVRYTPCKPELWSGLLGLDGFVRVGSRYLRYRMFEICVATAEPRPCSGCLYHLRIR